MGRDDCNRDHTRNFEDCRCDGEMASVRRAKSDGEYAVLHLRPFADCLAIKGYNLANSTEDSAFVHMAKFPGRQEQFARAMSLFSKGPGYSPKWLLENYPWDSLRASTIVDVGGSLGEYGIAIAQKYPQIKVIVQDLPDVVGRAQSSTSAELTDGITFMAHNFFTEQPIKGADVYLMRWILHDWSDAYAIRILRALIPALKKEAKIVLHEYIVPEPGETLNLQDRTLR